MSLKDMKIKEYETEIKELPDYPSDEGYSAKQLKEILDGRTAEKEIRTAINNIIDELCASSAAADIGTESGESVQDALNLKVSAQEGKGLSSNDFTTAEKEKLEGIETNAQVNEVNSVNDKVGDVVLTGDDIREHEGSFVTIAQRLDDAGTTYELLVSHESKNVTESSGVHGLRFYDGALQVLADGSWITVLEDLEAALDAILAIQDSLIGGASA